MITITRPEDDETHTSGRLTQAQEASIPTSLESSILGLRESVPGIIETLTRLSGLLERIVNREAANSADLLRTRMGLDSFSEMYSALGEAGSSSMTATNGSDADTLGHRRASSSRGSNEGTGVRAGRVGGGRPKEIEEDSLILKRDVFRFGEALSSLCEQTEQRCASFEDSTLEDIKLQRDSWRALAMLLDRYETRLKHDGLEKVKKRIEASQTRYATLQAAAKPNWHEEGQRLLSSIESDQDTVSKLLDRRGFLRYSVAQEIRWAWRWSAMLQDHLARWAQGGSLHADRVARIWTSLSEALAGAV